MAEQLLRKGSIHIWEMDDENIELTPFLLRILVSSVIIIGEGLKGNG